MNDMPIRTVLISPFLWRQREALRQTGRLDPRLPWERGALGARPAVFSEYRGCAPPSGRVRVSPGPIWTLSPRLRHIPLGISIDDGERPSPAVLAPEERERARAAAAFMADNRLSSRAERRPRSEIALPRLRALVAIRGTSADAKTRAAVAEGVASRAEASVLLLTGQGSVHAVSRLGDARIDIVRRPLARGLSPWALLTEVEEDVYTDCAEIALLARIAGRRVLPIGTDAGLASDHDRDTLLHECLISRPVYLDAWTRRPTSFENAVEQMVWLRERLYENSGRTVCIGMSRWKRRTIARFFDGPDGAPVFVSSTARAVKSAAAGAGRVVTWETRKPDGIEQACATAGVTLLGIEDGFLRSVGLGAALTPGASIVVDGRGIYFDPSRPSDLEALLEKAVFSEALVTRAARLRDRIVALRLSKYNVGSTEFSFCAPGQKTILVPGQVEDDASIMRGAVGVRTNLALLERVRQRHPEGYIVYKPHPDVEAGLRAGRIAPEKAARVADAVLTQATMADLLDVVDHVETMTSLTGFEALLRGKSVTTHGAPFYAGWGLTEDLAAHPRRTRRLSLDELVAGTLILYPRYIDPGSGLFCPPEVLVDRLAAQRAQTAPRQGGVSAVYEEGRRRVLALVTPQGRTRARP